ncbi:hypothetical protein [Nocardia sp. NPDC049707]
MSDQLTMTYSSRTASIALRALDPTTLLNLVCSNPWFIGGGGEI